MGSIVNTIETLPRPFNTPLETGLRSLFVLNAVMPQAYDVQRLVYYDYLLVHSGDIEDGPVSLHPPVPHRSCEWIVRRSVVYKGLMLMCSRQLLEIVFSDEGILYQATDLAGYFLILLKTKYAVDLHKRALWINEKFVQHSNEEIASLMNINVDKWGAEFIGESVVRGAKI